MSRRMTTRIKSTYSNVESISGLELMKLHTLKSKYGSTDLMAIFSPPSNLPPVPPKGMDPLQALSMFSDVLDTVLEAQNRKIDLSESTRFTMKESISKLWGVTTDDIRLVESDTIVIVYRLSAVKNFRKENGSYKWTWSTK